MEQLGELESDTLIISKLSKFDELIGEDTLKSAIEYGIRNKQNIYSLEYVDSTMYPDLYALASKYDLKIRHPLITDENLSYAKSIREMYGHYGVDIPVVGIFGTGTSQGKFTLQLELRRLFSAVGYKVKNLGTEMHSELFGFESYYPMEILRSIQFSQWDMIEFLQGEMRRLEIENPTPDIIFVGSQSGTIPKTYAIDSSIFTLPSIAFLMGTIPHAYILVVNSQDDDQYILDTIAAIQAIGKGKVICIVFSRLMRTAQNDFLLTQEDICFVATRIERLTKLPIVEIGSAEGKKRIVDIIVNHFL